MTPDQVVFRLCELDAIKNRTGRKRTVGTFEAVSSLTPDKDGLFKGRTADGKVIRAAIGGKSLARRLMEEEEGKKQEAARKKSKKRKRK